MLIRDAATLVWCLGKMQLRIAELDRLFQVMPASLLLSQHVHDACLHMAAIQRCFFAEEGFVSIPGIELWCV